MSWQPQEESLRQLSQVLRDTLDGADRSKQKTAEDALLQAASTPDYAYYLSYIFSNPGIGTIFLIRYAAAIQLKNFIKARYQSLPIQTIAYAKATTLQVLRDTNPRLRDFSGTIITEIIQQGGILQWPEVLSTLISLVSNEEGDIADDTQTSAMAALAKVCEDNKKLLDREYQGQRPTNLLIPKLLDLTEHRLSQIRVSALSTLRLFASHKSQVLFASMETYLQKIFQLATDQEVSVRRGVCQSIVQLVEVRPDLLAGSMEGLVNYILAQQAMADSILALDAAEFWLAVSEKEELRTLMEPFLDRVIPVLLAGMVYGEDDIERLARDEEDADAEDRAEDIKPQFAQTKAGRGATHDVEAENGKDEANAPQAQDMSDGEIEEEDEDEEEWSDDEDPEDQWSLRKCCASALDVFAIHYHGQVFSIILPYLRENLSHQLWPKREAAVLSLGAVAEGCLPVIAPHLPELVPFLINLLNDEEPVVRQITCWCLSRYSEWAAQLPDQADVQKYFEPMMDGLLKRMLDKNKKVQEAGASSFASLEEKAGAKLRPYVEPILRQFTLCFERYKDKNMYILYDCLQTLADSVGREMAKPELVNLLMPTLISRWNKIDDMSREMFPLLGCLGYIAIAYGASFTQFADPIFSRCLKLIFACIQQQAAYNAGQAIEQPDKDFIVTALDLLSAIVQAVDHSKSAQLVQTAQPAFYDLVSLCMQDSTDDVRQSAYALLGDCATQLYDTLVPQLPRLMPILTQQLDLDSIRDEDSDQAFNVLINISWSAGEIAARADHDQFQLYLEALYQALIALVKNEEVPENANENAATTLGRMGLPCPGEMAAHLPELAEPFLSSQSKIASSEEKASAFLGFNNMIMQNPAAMEGSLSEYFVAIAQFPTAQANQEPEFVKARESFQNVITGYKQMIPTFDNFVGSLPSKVQSKLRVAYQL